MDAMEASPNPLARALMQEHDFSAFLSVRNALGRASQLPRIGFLVPAAKTTHGEGDPLHPSDEDMLQAYPVTKATLSELRALRAAVVDTWVSHCVAHARTTWAVQGEFPPTMQERANSDRGLPWHRFELRVPDISGLCGPDNSGLCGPLTHADVTSVLASCVPSGYGDLATQTTRVDASVRSAHECAFPNASLGSCVGNAFTVFNEKCEFTREKLLRESWGVLQPRATHTLVPLKLNVYTPGGHFAPHVDTPTAENMVGTLVVSVPVEGGCVGGDLLVWPPGVTEAHVRAAGAVDDAASTVPPLPPPFSMHPHATLWSFAAFYGDCVHTVTPVQAGARVTYTFAVLAVTPPHVDAKKKYDELDSDDEGVQGASDRDLLYHAVLLCDVGAPLPPLPKALRARLDRGPIGFVLRHAYPLTVVPPCAHALKGVDAEIVPWLLHAVRGALLTPVAWRVYLHYYDDAWDDAARSYASSVHAFSTAMLADMRAGAPLHVDASLSSALTPPSRSARAPSPPRTVERSLNKRLHRATHTDALCPFVQLSEEDPQYIELFASTEAGGHTGNECEPHVDRGTYVAWAIVLPTTCVVEDAGTAAPSSACAKEDAGTDPLARAHN